MNEDGPLRPLVERWLQKIKAACAAKEKEFGTTAKEIMKFYDGPHDFMYEDAKAHKSGFAPLADKQQVNPTFGVTINKAAEAEQVFVPMIYNKNPVPVVRPRPELALDPVKLGPLGPMILPMMGIEDAVRKGVKEIRAALMDSVLNYFSDESDLWTHARLATSEGFLKGRSVLWIEVEQSPGMKMKTVGAFFDSVDNLVTDPDFTLVKDCYWIARKRSEPYWVVEEKFQWEAGSLKKYASCESFDAQSDVATDSDDGTYRRKQGTTSDLITYWEIYSKLGVGDRLGSSKATSDGVERDIDRIDIYQGLFDFAGDYVYLAVTVDCPHFLNLPPELVDAPMTDIAGPPEQEGVDEFGQPIEGPTVMEELAKRLEWPTPFHADKGWPFVELDLHPHPDQSWPVAHLKPAMGELKFMDWSASFLADAMMVTTRQFIAVLKSASKQVKDTIAKGECFSIIELEFQQKSLNEMIQFIQHAPISAELLPIFNLMSGIFDKRTGLIELVYGQTSKQIRSAGEAQVKSQAMNVRPDDMAQKVENWMKRVYRAMAMVIRWHLTPDDIRPALGEAAANLWQQFVYTADVEAVVRELDYTVEAGSGRKANKATEQENMQSAMQFVMPLLQSWAASTGDVNAINQLLYDWCRANDLDPERYKLPPLPPPPMLPAPGGEETGEGEPQGEPPSQAA